MEAGDNTRFGNPLYDVIEKKKELNLELKDPLPEGKGSQA